MAEERKGGGGRSHVETARDGHVEWLKSVQLV